MRARSKDWADRQRQSIRSQKPHHASSALQLSKLSEDELDASLHFFIGVENDCAPSIMGQPSGQRQPEFAPRRFLTFPLMQAHANLMQFRFTHDSGQSEQQAVMIDTRVVEALAIGNEHAEHRAEFQELMPIAIVAR
jgi:hypothetical protein